MKKLCIGLFTLLLCSVNFDSNVNFDFSTRNQETKICHEKQNNVDADCCGVRFGLVRRKSA